MKTYVHHPEASVVTTAVLLISLFIIGTDGLWLQSLPSVLRLTAQLGIVAIGQAILMTSGEVDLSVGSVFAITGLVFVTAMDEWGLGVASAMLLSIIFACSIGLLNALFSIVFRVPSMIVTLGGMFAFRGISYLMTEGFGLSIPPDLRADPLVLAIKTRALGLNGAVVVLLILTAIFAYILAKTRFGSHLKAVGGNAAAALANGVSPGLVKTKAFIICAGLAGLSAVVVVCQEGAVYGTSGVRMELETIAAAVIGGCTLRGGVGSIWGPVLGVFVLASLKSGLVLLGAPTSWYIAFVGALLIGFLVASSQLRKHLGVVA
jgi:ribose/xylose/arabinose/galactoside ABC-type transport system permease subunit